MENKIKRTQNVREMGKRITVFFAVVLVLPIFYMNTQHNLSIDKVETMEKQFNEIKNILLEKGPIDMQLFAKGEKELSAKAIKIEQVHVFFNAEQLEEAKKSTTAAIDRVADTSKKKTQEYFARQRKSIAHIKDEEERSREKNGLEQRLVHALGQVESERRKLKASLDITNMPYLFVEITLDIDGPSSAVFTIDDNDIGFRFQINDSWRSINLDDA